MTSTRRRVASTNHPFRTEVPVGRRGRRRRARVALLALAVAVVALTACGGGADPGALESSGWVLDQAESAISNPVEAARVTADFDGDAITGNAGCNRYRAAYATDGSRIDVDAVIATTRMLCTPENLAIESEYLARLAAARSWAVDGDRLVLTTTTDDLVFRATGG